MSEPSTQPDRSPFACRFCKKRKVKWYSGRPHPDRQIQLMTQQECDYPSEAARPGPKLGTTRRKRPRSSSREKHRDMSTSTDSALASGAAVESADSRTEVEATTSLVSSGSAANGSPTPTSASFNSGPIGGYLLTPVTTPLDVRTLAFIMHPSHETAVTLSNMEFVSISKSGATLGNVDRLAQACALLKVPANALQPYLNLYFDNMTSFSLFHRPSFAAKLCAIDSVQQLAALLASIFSFSARYIVISDRDPADLDDGLGPRLPPKHFEDMSQRCVDQLLAEYSDRSPPLCVLQALILNTFSQLIKGVRGAAWRRLGICVRVAYELDLHHVDRDNTPEQQDPDIWYSTEECRRAWWAIWEMDNFASLIRRCPTAVDGTDNETRFPVADEEWFARRFTPSCFLETKPMERLKALQRCGTQSPKAWFLVLDSLMREGHRLSKFRSPCPGKGTPPPSAWSRSGEPSKDNTESLAILANALRCFSMALPKQLRYRDGFLSFAANDPAVRQLHSAKYSIHVTTQLTRMMIHHQDAYHGAQQDLHLNDLQEGPDQDSDATAENESLSLRLGPAREGMQQFIEAADELLRIVSWSSEEHVRYVNPFLASTIWYGAVVHLGWKVLAPPSTNLDWVESKFTVLHMILMEFSEFWDLPKTLQENLASVEGKLHLFKNPKVRRLSHPNHSTNANRDRNATKVTARTQSTAARDLQAGGQVAAARSTMGPGPVVDTDCLPPGDQDDGHVMGSQRFLPTGLSMNHEGAAMASDRSSQEGRYASIDEVTVPTSMGGWPSLEPAVFPASI
ncbi:Fungal specific transcription factor domain-containing protein isoform 2 [Cladophialophora immunda]|nr:Fungal specific transcription factor domain-containing protein isoform 2 [Cladophialophora immunda]